MHSIKRRAAFIPFITAGDPDMDTTAEALRRLNANGASVIELGVPYSVRVSRSKLHRRLTLRSGHHNLHLLARAYVSVDTSPSVCEDGS